MNCCQCQGIEDQFGQRRADQDLSAYRRRGPSRTTRILLDALVAEHVEGMTVLDIGGGVGALQHGLLKAGATGATDVDASTAYIAVARAEAERQGHAGRVRFLHGNFVDLAPGIEPADIVTLDRVICCYHDMPALVTASAAKAGRLYGLVYPRETWWMRLGLDVINFVLRLQRTAFRVFMHPTAAVDAVVRDSGLERRFHRETMLWQIVVYARPDRYLMS